MTDTRSTLTCAVAAAACLAAACSGKTTGAAAQGAASAPTAVLNAPAAVVASRAEFVGPWSFATRCNSGHYVTLDIDFNRGNVTGAWSDGTDIRGNDGDLRGLVRGDRLIVQRCAKAVESGGEPVCPSFEKSHDYFVRQGLKLVWFQTDGGTPMQYVLLKKGDSKADPAEQCDD